MTPDEKTRGRRDVEGGEALARLAFREDIPHVFAAFRRRKCDAAYINESKQRSEREKRSGGGRGRQREREHEGPAL